MMLNNQPFIRKQRCGRVHSGDCGHRPEPLLVLDKDLRLLAASRLFYLTFRVAPTNIQGRLLYVLGDGQCSPSAWSYNEVTTTFSG
jgi:hypothetical protein